MIKGHAQVLAKLGRLAANLPGAVERALFQEALVEAKESMRRTPVMTGALRASHQVQDPVHSGRDVSVPITVGGPAAPYAVYVHENLEAYHPVGQAKFLESTLKESAPHMAARVARRLGLVKLV